MEVTVAFTTQLKAALGKSQQTVQLPADATAMAAIESLAQNGPPEFSQYVLADGKLLPSILLCVNDNQAHPSEKLCDGDTLTLLSAISGG